MSHVMVDLETFGKKPGCVIASIGAVKMDLIERSIVDSFYVTIDVANAQAHGLTVDASTVQWWLQQSDHARKRLSVDPTRLPTALISFSTWLGGDCTTLWGNGSDFDNAILQAAYEACGLPVPWTHRANRDYRTVKNLFSDRVYFPPDNEQGHDALADARWQAQHLLNIFAAIGMGVRI
jgi:hypothetical protein